MPPNHNLLDLTPHAPPTPRPRRFGGGIPLKQYQLILRDGVHMSAYAARTFDGVAQATHLRRDNYFYYNCLTGGGGPRERGCTGVHVNRSWQACVGCHVN